jgi:hypothetical protein
VLVNDSTNINKTNNHFFILTEPTERDMTLEMQVLVWAGYWLMNIPSATSEAVTVYPFGAPEFTPGF